MKAVADNASSGLSAQALKAMVLEQHCFYIFNVKQCVLGLDLHIDNSKIPDNNLGNHYCYPFAISNYFLKAGSASPRKAFMLARFKAIPLKLVEGQFNNIPYSIYITSSYALKQLLK